MFYVTQKHQVTGDKLNREFRQEMLGKVMLTEIIYLPYDNGKWSVSTNSEGDSDQRYIDILIVRIY